VLLRKVSLRTVYVISLLSNKVLFTLYADLAIRENKKPSVVKK
jgi:hypothetical protein